MKVQWDTDGRYVTTWKVMWDSERKSGIVVNWYFQVILAYVKAPPLPLQDMCCIYSIALAPMSSEDLLRVNYT